MNHVQSIISTAIESLDLLDYSCVALKFSCPAVLLDGCNDPIPLVQEYCKFSGAWPVSAGFDSVHWPAYDKDNKKSEAELEAAQQYRFNYRLEMLYYFWMANQEM